MKYCNVCGAEINDDAIFCTSCGAKVVKQETNEVNNNTSKNYKKGSDLSSIAKAFMIIGTVIQGIYIIPLLWCIPMTSAYSKKLKNGEPISTGFKICSLLFVNTIAGILMLIDNSNN